MTFPTKPPRNQASQLPRDQHAPVGSFPSLSFSQPQRSDAPAAQKAEQRAFVASSPAQPTASSLSSSSSSAQPSAAQSPFHVQSPARPRGGVRREVMRTRSKVVALPLKNAVAMSTGLHLVGPFFVWGLFIVLAALLMWLMNINLWDLFKHDAKKPDMVFVLVQDTQAERPEHAKMKGEFNQKAGGENDPNRELAPPEREAAARQEVVQPQRPAVQPAPPKPQAQPTPKPQQQQPPKPPEPQAKQPDKPAPAPTFKPRIATPAAVSKPQAAAQPQTPTGPVSPARPSAPSASSTPAPVTLPSQGHIAMASPSGQGSNNSSNPQGGPGRAGVDVEQDADFGPLMADLERRIKRNWNPPRGSRSKRIKVKFYLQRDGQVAKIDMLTSSGDAVADDAAVRAIQVSAPFRTFPPQVRENVIPVEFTFDYNVFNPQNAR